jgi:L-lactate dehydrogenase (cytochrome)
MAELCALISALADVLNLIEKEMKVAMTLTGAKSISEISKDSLVQELSKLPAALAPLSQGNAA